MGSDFPENGSALDAFERVRLLKNYKIRIGEVIRKIEGDDGTAEDIEPESKIGHIVFGGYAQTDQVLKCRSYD
jgi:hypothetical protein